jgi:hypothetical protein
MRRTTLFLLAFAVLAPSAFAHESPSGAGTHYLRWAVVSHGNISTSDTDGLNDVDLLRRQYGDEFLYIWSDDQRYVIRDRAMVDRAYRASEEARVAQPIVTRTRKTSKPKKFAAKRLKHQVREIFEEAKARHLAERVE